MERFLAFVLGLVLVAFWLWVIAKLWRGAKTIDRERFDRTNASGVMEFATYEDKVRFERKEGLNTGLQKFMGGVGFIGFLFGVALLAYGVFG